MVSEYRIMEGIFIMLFRKKFRYMLFDIVLDVRNSL